MKQLSLASLDSKSCHCTASSKKTTELIDHLKHSIWDSLSVRSILPGRGWPSDAVASKSAGMGFRWRQSERRRPWTIERKVRRPCFLDNARLAMPGAPSSLLLVAMPFAPSSVLLLLVAMPFAPRSVLLLLVAMPFAPSSVLLLLVAMPFAPSSVLLLLVAMPFAPSSVLLLLVAMPFAPSSVLLLLVAMPFAPSSEPCS